MAILKVQFQESRYSTLYHDLRVFICGTDVSDALKGEVSVSVSDSAAPNNATLSLSNALDRFVFTEANQNGVYGDDPWGRYSESAKLDIVDVKTGQSGMVRLRDREKTIIRHFNALMQTLDDEGAQITSVPEPAPGADNQLRLTLTGEGVEHIRNSNVKANNNAIHTTVDSLVRRLGPEFFSPETTDGTRKSILDHVSTKYRDYNELDLSAIEDTVNRAIKKRNTAFFDANEIEDADSIRAEALPENQNPTDPNTGVTVHEFHPGKVVIEKNDPILIFAHNPYTEKDEWYPAFCGFINTVTDVTDETKGESTLIIQAYCIKHQMKQMRVVENPALAVWKPDLVFRGNGYFGDQLGYNATGFTNPVSGASLEQIVSQLVTGSFNDKKLGENAIPNDASGQALPTPGGNESNVSAVGRFSLGEVLRYEGAASVAGVPASSSETSKTLEEWHALSVFGSTKTVMTEADVYDIGWNSYIGGDYEPWNRKLHMLLPRQGSSVYTLAETAPASNLTQFQFTNRWEIITRYSQLLDYQVITSPFGDLLLEFPMYDFLPEDFGTTWSPMFKYFHNLIDSSDTPITESIPAGVVVTGTLNPLGITGEHDDVLMRAMAFSKAIATRFGVYDVEYVSVPFIRGGDTEKLKAYAALYYQRKLADASSLSFVAVHRPWMMPNRPITHERKRKLGMTYSIETTWEIGGIVSTDLALKCIREKIVSGGQAVYRFATGGTQMAVTYRLPSDSVVVDEKAAEQPITQESANQKLKEDTVKASTPTIDQAKVIKLTQDNESRPDYYYAWNSSGVAFGIIQFHQKSSLGTLLSRMRVADPKAFDSLAGEYSKVFLDEQWIRTTDLNADPRIKEALVAMGKVKAFQKVQDNLTLELYYNPATSLCTQNGLKSERARAMIFDACVFRGLAKTKSLLAKVIQTTKNDKKTKEKDILKLFAELADTNDPGITISKRSHALYNNTSLSDDTGADTKDEGKVSGNDDNTQPKNVTIPLSPEASSGIQTILASEQQQIVVGE